MLVLYLDAPFAACRSFTAGWYRPTATFLTPSAAYGLLLNLAGIESRLTEEDPLHRAPTPCTLTKPGLPRLRLALGASTTGVSGTGRSTRISEADRYPRVATLFQQIHNYPVGSSGSDRAAETYGNKYNIAPVRRELLVGLRAIIAVDCDPAVEAGIRAGLAGEHTTRRYGLPFVGDNSLLPDRIDRLDAVPEAHWYEMIREPASPIRPRTTRMTVWIDRADMSRSRSELYAPTASPSSVIPATAWTEICPP